MGIANLLIVGVTTVIWGASMWRISGAISRYWLLMTKGERWGLGACLVGATVATMAMWMFAATLVF